MIDREKVVKGLEAHEKGCGYRSHYCDVVECPYRYWDESCNIEEMCHDALTLLKEQEEKPLRCDKCSFHREDGWCGMHGRWVTETDYCSWGAWKGR